MQWAMTKGRNWFGGGLAICLAASLLIGCGGGGGQTQVTPLSQADVAEKVVLTLEADKITVTTVEGVQGTTDGFFTLVYKGNQFVLYGLEEHKDLIVDGEIFQVSDTRFKYHLVLSDKLAPGDYVSEVIANTCEVANESVQDCTDAAITRRSVPLHYVVKPNIHVQSNISLQRTGRDPAPSQTVPVSIPKDAGTVTVSLVSDRPDVMTAELFDGQLTIRTVQAQAGDYAATVILQGSADPAYRQTVQVAYTVLAPAGGEHDLSVQRISSTDWVEQGKMASVRFKVTRPTWISWKEPQFLNSDRLFSYRKISDEEYEITVDARNAEQTSYRAALRFNDGTPVGDVDAQFYVNVSNAFYACDGSPFGYYLTPDSQESTFTRSTMVHTMDGVQQKWTAVASQPWIKLLTSSGATGKDALVAQVDKTAAVQGTAVGGKITISIDREGVAPIQCGVGVQNDIPRVTRIVGGPLTGDRGRIYVDGAHLTFAADLLERGFIKVSGAQLDALRVVQDSRMLSPTELLAVDVSNAVPGQAVSISIVTPLMTSEVKVPVLPLEAAPAGYLPLPYGRYRPAQYSAGLQALYFAAQGQVWRWAHDGPTWAGSQAALAGVVDVAPGAGADELYAVTAREVYKLDPVTLAEIRHGTYKDEFQSTGTWREFDASTPWSMNALSFASESRALASLVTAGDLSDAGSRAVSAIRGQAPNMLGGRSDLSDSPTRHEPGNRFRTFASMPEMGAGIVRSQNGEAVLAVDPDGVLSVYRASVRQWADVLQVPPRISVAAVDNDGDLLIRSDGVVQVGNTVMSNSLSDFLPQSYVSGGYALAGNGQFAVIYGYRIAMENGQQRARGAALWLIDLRALKARSSSGPTLLGSVALPDAVGCTMALASGESCVHAASITVSPSSLNAFVLGPRGIASVRLPSSPWSAPGAASAVPETEKARASAVRHAPPVVTKGGRFRGRLLRDRISGH